MCSIKGGLFGIWFESTSPFMAPTWRSGQAVKTWLESGLYNEVLTLHRICFLSLNKTKPGSRLSLWIDVSEPQYAEVFKHSGFVSPVPTNSLRSVRPGTWITFAECWLCARHGCGSFHLFLMTILLSRHYLSSPFFAEQKTD